MDGFAPPTGVIVKPNGLMRPILDSVLQSQSLPGLPRELKRVRAGGLVAWGDRVYMRPFLGRVGGGPGDSDFDVEWWVNDINLDSTLQAAGRSWRSQVLAWALRLGDTFLEQAIDVRPDLPVQMCITLQSAPGLEDPEIDFATGKIHLYGIRRESDDLSTQFVNTNPEPGGQPILFLTTPGSA